MNYFFLLLNMEPRCRRHVIVGYGVGGSDETTHSTDKDRVHVFRFTFGVSTEIVYRATVFGGQG